MRRVLALVATLLAMSCSSEKDDRAMPVTIPSPPGCITADAAQKKGVIDSPALKETSGLAASTKTPGILWTHNDSGDSARIFAMRAADAHVLAEVKVDGATATDWEAIAVAPWQGAPSIWIGDIGDNDRKRGNVTVWIVAEPSVEPAPTSVAVSKRIDLRYEDGAHNAEALLVDPTASGGNEITIVTKEDDGASGIFAADLATGVLTRKGGLQFGRAPLDGDPLVTDGSVSADGSLVALRTYNAAFVWTRAAGTTVAAALAGRACPLRLVSEPQGEALTFAHDRAGFFTTSEKPAQPLWYFTLTKPGSM